MFQRMLEKFLAQFVTPERLNEVAEYVRRAAYRAVDMGIAAAITAILAYLNRPADDIVLGPSYYCLGSTPAEAVGSSAFIFGLVSLVRYLLPIVWPKIFGRQLLAFLALASLCGPSMAGEIEGSLNVPEHRLVRLSAKVDEGSRVFWFVFPPAVADVDINGNSLRFVAPPGRYDVYLNEIPRDDTRPIEQTFAAVTIGGNPQPLPVPVPPGPAPGPPLPGPAPTPTPSFPDGQFKFASWAFDNARAINDPAGAAALSSSIKSMLAAYAAGTLKAADFLPTLRSTLNDRGPRWEKFRKDLAARLNELGFRSRPPADWVTAGNEIVLGLDAIK